MGKTPRHRRTWHAARNRIALTTAFALIVAPLIVILTHGPAANANAASITAELAEEIAAHGHDHSHGHTHDDTERGVHGEPFAAHNPADHDHHLYALVCHAADTTGPHPDSRRCALNSMSHDLTLDGPMRPPRSV